MKTHLLVSIALIACLGPAWAYADLLLAASSADAVYRFDGVTSTLFASDPSMDGPTALVYDASGNLLVLDEFSHNVLKFNGTTGAFLSTFISSATLATADPTFDPADMELGPDGNLYIMSHFNAGPGSRNIHKFDGTSGAYLGVFSSAPPTHHEHGLAFGTGGHLYQGNVDSGLIEKFDGTTGATLGAFTSAPVSPIADLAFSTTTLYVTLDGAAGVARFNPITGAAMAPLIPAAAGESYWGILVDGSDLYLSNTFTNTLRHYNATSGAFISDTVIGGGAFDIIAMPVPEPGVIYCVGVGLVILAASRQWNRRACVRPAVC